MTLRFCKWCHAVLLCFEKEFCKGRCRNQGEAMSEPKRLSEQGLAHHWSYVVCSNSYQSSVEAIKGHIAALETELAAAKDRERWIPVSEQAPPEIAGKEIELRALNRAGLPGTVVAHWMSGGYCIEDHPAIDAGWYFWNGSLMDIVAAKVTHWRPLPSPPAEQEKQR